MSQEPSRERAGLSPTQRKACIVLALCALAIIVTFVAAWILPSKLSFGGSYDPDAYPVDTSLGAVLGETSADDSYITGSVFAGDNYVVSLQKDSRIGLDQYVGKDGLQVSQVLRESCVNFTEDANSYTIPQAVSKMKARRVFVMIGSNDVDGSVSADSFINDYKQMLQSIHTAYSYCDVIAVSIPPVTEGSSDAATTQTTIDLFNQSIAKACDDLGFKFANAAEVLKNDKGYAESSYFDGDNSAFSTSGARTLLEYLKSHAYQTDDTRPDTNDIPKRAAQASSASATAAPTATPSKATYSYTVEAGKGTLTGNGETAATSIEIDAQAGDKITITAVAADGYVFYKWSDGITTEKRVDIATESGKSVQAMFNDARVELTLDKGDTTIKSGESLTVNASVTLGGKTYDASSVQWSVNDELEQNGSTYVFTSSDAGTYTVKAGIEINGTFSTAQLTVTVESTPTTISISGNSTITEGQSVQLNASIQNGSGETTWNCGSWSATGDNVTFTPDEAGTYAIYAQNNGVTSEPFVLTVNAATPAPPSPPSPPSQPGDDEG